MIKSFDGSRLDELMKIWLETNLEAHYFVSADYWLSQFDSVKTALSQAEIYYFEEENLVRGFVGLDDWGSIAGLFVAKPFRSLGIGRLLINECKRRYSKLVLNVFVKNKKAVLFYQKQKFSVQKKIKNIELNELEYKMNWDASNFEPFLKIDKTHKIIGFDNR